MGTATLGDHSWPRAEPQLSLSSRVVRGDKTQGKSHGSRKFALQSCLPRYLGWLFEYQLHSQGGIKHLLDIDKEWGGVDS